MDMSFPKLQGLVFSITQNQAEIDKMSDDSSDLVGISGDTRISVNVQQITSRFKTIQVTSKVSVAFQVNMWYFA